MRIAAYFAGWLLALPGILLAAAILALHRAVALGNLFAIAWEALVAFAYGLPLAGLAALVVCILGFFRMGRVIGAGMPWGAGDACGDPRGATGSPKGV
jgi:hypothetical protein